MDFAKDLGEGQQEQAKYYLEEFKKDRVKVKRDAHHGPFVASNLMFPLKPPAGCTQGTTRHTIVCDGVDFTRSHDRARR